MYLGKRQILDLEKYNEHRTKCIEYKPDATFTAFSELEDIINKTQLAKQYFGKSHGWLSQRIHGCMVMKKAAAFKKEEYHSLAEAFRDIAKRLQAHADEIDAAKYE
ncbi:MAG: DUF5053 domain-containing protein [Alistipes sp.]|nr:DUF5053 domain-containing protein [Alistipes sp.]